MKEFKFCGEMTEYVEIPVMVCETQKEMVNEISEVREVSFNDYIYEKVESIEFNRQCAIKERKEHGYSAWFYDEQIRSVIGTSDETSIYIIYKDGSKYFETFGERQGKFKRYGIKAAVIETAFEYTVYGDFAVTDNGDISIEESDIEEYGVYNGQYDVKEEPEAAETVESVETKEKITMTKAEKIFETLTEDCETFIKEHTDFENTLTFSHRYFDEYNACVRTYNAVLKLVEKRYKDIVRKIKLGVWTTEDAHLPVLVNDAVKRTVEDAKMMEQKFQKELKEIHATFEETEENDEVTTVDSVEETTVSETVEETAEQETEINAEVEAEQTAENKTETTAENITVSGTNQDNINVLIVADIANTFKMITHTGYFDTS